MGIEPSLVNLTALPTKLTDICHSIAMKQRVARWNLDYLAKVLGVPVL